MATVRLKMRRRTDTGKQATKRMRACGDVPAVLYGEKQENVPILIEANEFRTALSTASGRNVIIQLVLEGEDSATRAVIRDMERDALTREILHVDLQRISENKPVVMHVPVTLVGESQAVKEGRGILDHALRQLEVKCLPRDIPEHIEVDISQLEVRHAIHVRDVVIDKLEILDHPDRPVVEVLQPTLFKEADEELEGAEAGEGEAGEGEGAGGASSGDHEEKS